MANNMYTTNDGLALASLMHSDGYKEGPAAQNMVGSAALNVHDVMSPLGMSLPDVISNNFSHAQTDPNFIDANTHSFKTKEDENHYKRTLQLAHALMTGAIPRNHEGHFYGKSNHVRNMVRSKNLDLKTVDEVGRIKGKQSTFRVFKNK